MSASLATLPVTSTVAARRQLIMQMTCYMLSLHQLAMMSRDNSIYDFYGVHEPPLMQNRASGHLLWSSDSQLFAGMCYALLGPDGKVSRVGHLNLNGPKSTPMQWTGVLQGAKAEGRQGWCTKWQCSPI